MSALLRNKWVAIVFVAIVLLGGAYYLFMGQSSDSATVTETTTTSPLSQNILNSLAALHTITLDPSLFKDPVFMSLTDFGVTIPTQQAGRRNPFAPLSGAGAQDASSTTPAL